MQSMDSTRNACSTVLNTVELLEAILLNTSITIVLFAQRVCQQWRATIQGSEKLQELLFLRARITKLIPLYHSDPKGNLVPDHHTNPLLIFTKYAETAFGRYLGIPGIGALPKDKTYSAEQPLPLVDALIKKPISSWAHPTASWRKMHLCNPSTTHVIVALDLILPHQSNQKRASPWSEAAVDWRLVHNSAGVCAGNVFELAFQLWKYHEGKFIASVRILAQPNGPWYNEAVDVIHKTEIGRTTINGQRMELMRLDQWRCEVDPEIAEEQDDEVDSETD